MSGVINKVKEVLHKDKDTTHNDSTTGVGHSGTTGHGTLNPADRNNDGRVDAHDVTGQHGSAGGLTGHNTTGHGTANPLDRNNDGKVGAGDLTGHGSAGGVTGHNTTHGSAGGLTGTGHSTTGHGVAGNDPFAGQGSYDATGPHSTRTANVLDPHVQGGAQSGLAHGTGHSPTGVAGAGGLTSGGHQQAGVGGAQSGFSHGTAGNTMTGSLDRNNDGRINAGDLAPGAHGHSSLGGAGPTATGGVGQTGTGVGHSGLDARDATSHGHSSLGGAGHYAAGGVGQTGTGAGLDTRDATSHGHSSLGGADHHSAGGVGQAGLDARDATSHGHASHGGHTHNPLDRNNDGKVDAHDLKSGSHSSSSPGGTKVITGTKQGNELEHRSGESGDLPKALTEPYSKAEPHHGSGLNPAHTTARGETRASGSVKDKLDPHTDADRDGKAGVMD